ncbi:beta-mannosidase [Flavobacterium sedimenticola]|uniref:Beta-mannosidase B n=1 Tax=Flavobacterium sedimenticola TaxID=3043286 RepID=A0ABT6XNB5_9FLAO|nr:glycoside hydrolase family 2 protein [Flavobacterium sedimenticola]MDI9256568.1 glycoside hydrolase family 2 protein [Flavobacterium sedimenticola]
MRKLWLIFVLFFCLPMVLWAQNNERNLSSEKWQFKGVNNDKYKWYPAKVPGTVHTDLLTNKLIPNPFFGANEKQLQWIENEDWQYQTTFSISKEEWNHQNAILQFNGLDTFAEVFLNGTKILSADNMFRTWKIDVKKLLKIGPNQLEITFVSAVKKGKEAVKKLPYTLPGDEKIFTRKAQYHFGWDWGPRFVTSGVYRNVVLHFWDNATLETVKSVQKNIFADKAELQFEVRIKSVVAGNFQLKINDKIQSIVLKKGQNHITVNSEIQNPKLWWPNGLGEAHLYPFEVSLVKNNQTIDRKKLKIGLRTIELVQEKDHIGKSFYFKVNGQPVFIKGANVVPPDSFLPRATDSVYQSIVKNAVDTHMNMLRVWGGGVYADDAFYEACDKNGILVWQDFMFACAMYPGDEAFLSNVKQEVIDNVSRLQNHPSIALWCGNNENDEGWHNWGWQKQYKYTAQDSTKIWKDYQKLFHELIPKTLDSLLPENENRYWPSSPSIGWGRKESLLSGDAHYWGVWWGMEPFDMYRQKVGRFMSEYGFQGMPDVKTFQAFANNGELNFDSEAVKSHQKHPTGYKTINAYMARDYKVPNTFEDYIYVSQLLQADGMKTAIEAHRTDRKCMGTLFWQLNDCWPVTSWSSVDYYGRWKAFQYQARRSFEKVLLSVQEKENQYDVIITNDDVIAYDGGFALQLFDFNGELLWDASAAGSIPASSALVHFEIPKMDLNGFDLAKAVLSVSFTSEKKSAYSLYYFVKPKELQLIKPNLQITKLDELTYEISTDVLAKNVFLSSEEDAFFSDNYFDILPGQKVLIKLAKPVKAIRVKSLFEVMKN